MKIKPVLIFFGVFTFLMGLIMAFLPNIILKMVVVQNNPTAELFLRLFGAMIFYNGVVFLGSRNTVDLRVLRSFCLGSILTDGFCAVALYLGAQAGIVAGLAFVFSGIFALFCLIYLVTLLRLPRD